ncbi:hypothetical protein J25TS5_49140 [Paenibacillus faecis]|uniref:hypothetical protein n=1 Tax=Paenibacillus faecis TaxID=862114 RepID=UPI001B14AE79|nr:hypothetical protein [Paenibacillus faecis]GIO87982.1 hypothetical protein J25TS5_49140 [Paenibacillus faecis]
MRNRSSNNKNPPNHRIAAEADWAQPERCVRCVWGRLEGNRQFCSLPRCVAAGSPAEGR